MDYYEVHCTNCGKTTSAERMALNLDELVREHLKRVERKSTNSFYKEAAEVFGEIRIGLYLTKYEMVNDGILDEEDRVRLRVRDVAEYIEKFYDVTLMNEQTSTEQDEMKAIDAMLRSAVGEDIPDATEDLEPLVDDLSFKLTFYNEIDSDEREKRNYIRRLIKLLRKASEEILLECGCEFLIQRDDGGKEFISAFRVTYIDNEIVAYNHMVCPYCGENYFVDAGRYDEKIIVMLGSSRVGKTAYLAALVDEINPIYGQSRYPNIVIRDTVDKRYVNFKNNILETYRQGKKITKTDESAGEVALFPLEIDMNGKTSIFYFVDLPGEVFVPRDEKERESGAASGRFIINHRKICYSADAFWFCIDPVQIDMRLHGINEATDKSDRVEMDMDMVLSNIENTVNMMGVTKTKTPTAVVITKSDLIAPQENLYSNSQNIGGECLKDNTQFRLDNYIGIANNVKRYLMSGNVKNIVPKIEKIFDFKSYFSVAAYGRNVESHEAENMKAPYGISLPFLWTITCLGYLRPVSFVQRIERKGLLHRQEEIIQYFEPAESGELFIE